MGGRVVVLMGVSGSGKTTVGERLAGELGWRFVEGDEYHSDANVRKMREGEPLTDEDRAGWLERLRDVVSRALDAGESLVVASSALKEGYRRRLRVDPDRVDFVLLRGEPEVIGARLRDRHDHFMPGRLLASQYEALEPPEDAPSVDVDRPAEEIVHEIREELEL